MLTPDGNAGPCAEALSNLNNDDCSSETLGALMPVPALNVSFVSPRTARSAGRRRYEATDSRGVAANPNTAL